MPKQFLRCLVCLILVIFLFGCSARTYTQVKEREDQEMVGNAGYLSGTPPPIDRSDSPMTRKIYVLEIQSRAAAREDKEIEEMIQATEEALEEARRDLGAQKRALGPRKRRAAPRAKSSAPGAIPPAFDEYTVQKDDTLQKISFKYYDTNHKWRKILDANKDILKDPNRIKPGMVLRIPLE